MEMLVPPDLEVRAAALIGVPFVEKGDDPRGWDCRGLARWCLEHFCGVATPDYRSLYTAETVRSARGAERARLIAEGLADWRPVEPQAGAVAWLEWLGRAGHVAFMLGPTRVLHADRRAGTVWLDLNDPAAGWRLRGAFVPGWIESIRQA